MCENGKSVKLDDFKSKAEAHWAYIKSVMLQQLEVSGKMYVDAMVHGYKHGVEASTSPAPIPSTIEWADMGRTITALQSRNTELVKENRSLYRQVGQIERE